MAIIAGFIVPHPPIIIPEIGKGEEKKLQQTANAFHRVAEEIAKIKPDTIIISSPHSPVYGDYFHISNKPIKQGSFKQFGARKVEFSVKSNAPFIKKIESTCLDLDFPMGILGNQNVELDHGIMVPMYFLNKHIKDYKVVLVSPSGLTPKEHYQAGKIISDLIEKEEKVVWVASGDLSHKLKSDGPYGLSKEGPIFDREITKILSSSDFIQLMEFDPIFCKNAAECGLGSFTMMAGAFDGYDVKTKVLSYEGPFGVGYTVATCYPIKVNNKRKLLKQLEKNEQVKLEKQKLIEDEYVLLARTALELYVRNHEVLDVPENITPDLINHKAGVFVSIHKNNKLRGCIGTIQPTTASIAEEIIQNAISSGTRDYRFHSISEEELPLLEISVDVLFPPEPIDSITELDTSIYGVIVRYKHKSGLLLPNLDGIDTVEEQVRVARHKAGIRENEPYTLERFKVVRHH